MVLDRDVELDGHVVGGLGVEGHVLVLGHEVDVMRDVEEGNLYMEAGPLDGAELAEALDDGDVLLAHDVTRGDHHGADDDEKDDGSDHLVSPIVT